jgi:Ricin-type beta-trefoil lectin domain
MKISLARFAPCLQAQGDYDGAPVVLATCGNFNGADKEWNVIEGGAAEASGNPGPVTQIRLFGDKCLDVPNGNDSDGVKLQIWTCYDGNPNQLWQVNSDDTISWAYHAK